ncbi:hypothetical protein BJV82DRAFT_117768 [Fennellomyces sp. T-0311]|nr:hypothetical protein BJV82DRAFT_117768 [Fennellomyces sp. T-0311]
MTASCNKSNNSTSASQAKSRDDPQTMTRMHPSMKRPRAPIACFRCHHKKVRCDGVHPNCTRCLTTGVLCAYPSSRRSRNTQPTNVDPFIDNLSHLEARIRRIESDLESQRAMMHSICNSSSTSPKRSTTATNNAKTQELATQMRKTEQEVQESRSILAQLRLRGEQRIARGKRGSVPTTSTTSPKQQRKRHRTAEDEPAEKAPPAAAPSFYYAPQDDLITPPPSDPSYFFPPGASHSPFADSLMMGDWSLFNHLPYDGTKQQHEQQPQQQQQQQPQSGIAPPLLSVNNTSDPSARTPDEHYFMMDASSAANLQTSSIFDTTPAGWYC